MAFLNIKMFLAGIYVGVKVWLSGTTNNIALSFY